ncbi:Phosphoribosyl 1,2-cyclic phosphate 1,2-diphosphodiesterase [Anaerolineales bacterium]|nr:Phosphoribosyl 1,2-cyclic phosphate 1,2-diphosphodiesterase [Anaerolineales bacterium]
MGKADLHIHTAYSMDGTASVREVLESAVRTGLDVIAITDHNEIQGALEAREICKGSGVEVIPGVEVTTREGHLVALFVEQNIPRGMPVIEALLLIHEMGGLGIAPHPQQPVPNSITLKSIQSALEHPLAREALLGIEVCNMNPSHSPYNRHSQQIADGLPLARIASSDAHMASMIGAGVTHFEGDTAQDLRHAIQHCATRPEQVNYENSRRVFLRWLRLYIRRQFLHPKPSGL